MFLLSWLDRRIDERLALHQSSVVEHELAEPASTAEKVSPDNPLPVQVVEPNTPNLILHRRSGLPAVTSEDPELAALLNEQLVLHQRDNVLIGATITLASVGALLLSFYLSEFPELCTTRNAAGCISNDETYLLAPLPVLAIAGILVFLTLNSHITASLLHKVELALQQKVDFELPVEADRGEKHPVKLPSSSTLWGLIFSSKMARTLRKYQISNLVTLIAIIGLIAGLLIPVMSRVSSMLQLVSLAIYGPAFVALYIPFHRSAGTSRRVFNDALDALHDLDSPPPSVSWFSPDPVTGRSPIGYLVIPRPTELIFKSSAVLGSMIIVRLVTSRAWIGWWRAVVAYLIFEFVVYQSRYMFNDAIDYAIDRSHARPVGKGRAPDMGPHTRRIIRLTATSRVLASLAVALAVLPRPVDLYLIYGGAAVLFFMGPYDRFAEYSRERWGNQPNPASLPNASWLGMLPDWPANIRIALVAPGYAIRGMVGAAIALNGWPSLQLSISLALMLGALEASNVALAWVSEGAASVARDRPQYRASLERRPHMGWLLLHAGVVDKSFAAVEDSRIERVEDRASDSVLLTSTGVNGPRVWNGWMVISTVGAALTGAILNHQVDDIPWTDFLVVGSSALAIGLLLLIPARRGRRIRPSSAQNWTVLVVAALVATATTYHTRNEELIWPAIVAIALVAIVYQGTRLSTYEAYISIARKLMRAVASGLHAILKVRRLPRIVIGFFVGQDVWERGSQ